MVERRRLIVSPIWLALTAPIAVAAGLASAAGAFMPSTYARETASWAAQGVGQDLANFFAVLPALIFCAVRARRGSIQALLVWQGLLLYLVYSYVLYAFFVHFGALFLVYVAALGFSFYALAGSVLDVSAQTIAARFHDAAAARRMSVLLLTTGLLFAVLWLADIVRALASGGVPPSVVDVGLPVNPIHVLDLAFALPALTLTGWLLRRRHPYAIAFAAPLATFLIAMGLAIIVMVFAMRARGVAVSLAMPAIVTAIVVVAGVLTASYLRDCDRAAAGKSAAA
jgi:hypothetical protein